MPLQLEHYCSAEYLRYHGILPKDIVDGRLLVAVHGAADHEVLDDLEHAFGHPLSIEQVEREALEQGIALVYLSASEGAANEDFAGPSYETDARDLANQPPVVRFVNALIRDAHAANASDIHVESTRQGLVARYRIDGVLADAPSPPAGLQAAVVSRIKLIADLDITERRSPQDGRIRIRLDERELDLRVSSVPTLHGESLVLRLLEQGGRPVTLEELGMPLPILSEFSRAVRKPHGIVLATGPTGSGKTTTLYSAVRIRDAVAEKIITVEDPIEYQLKGITQVPVNAKAGMTFAGGLRSILRQDPDVIMVGEMRDRETASIAIQAAMTGHLVFSTLHTNDAARALTRLIDLGVEPFLLAATIEGVLAQRLVRRICSECATECRLSDSLRAAMPAGGEGIQMRRGFGCDRCRGTGFRGRIGIFEYVPMTDVMREVVSQSADSSKMRVLAKGMGFGTLEDDGWDKVRSGITTPEEVLRVVQV